MTKQYSIASVIPAYNGAGVLPRLLDALKRQTRKLDEIVVVNNASTDETARLLAANYPDVTVLNQPTNGGVGGGLSAGLDYAVHSMKHDWVWLLDQDSLPADDALTRLLDGLDTLAANAGSIAMLAPLCMNRQTQAAYAASSWRHGLRKSRASLSRDSIYFVDSVISSGTLLRREAVEEVGLPRADFFMDFVDHEYCLRVRRHGYKIAVVPQSRLEHAIGTPVQVRIFGRGRVWTAHAPWREYYKTRNEIFTVWRYSPGWRSKLTVGGRLLRHAVGVLLFGRERAASFKMMYRGILDGCRGRLGIRYCDSEHPTRRSSPSSHSSSRA
ncbi:MAG TPA: glycosyltransferase [Candidatus Sulfotelmatobacter sp.]|nr:glycosyltransferase [Candidatus Sulfotelmatobacter sp.]